MNWNTLNQSTLENEYVKLRLLQADDKDELRKIVFDEDTWTYFVSRIETEADLDAFVENGLRDIENGTRYVYIVIDKATNRIAGSMCYGNLSEADKKLEIGWSWLGREFRGSGLNKYTKLALLEQAFEELDCERVEFKTDVLNMRARKGLIKIGATEEGVLRSFNYMPDGRRRDAIFFSVLKNEWADVKNILTQRKHDAA